MPIYEYSCGACGHQFEEWQKMSDPPVRTCPKCKKKKVEKLISQTSFTLKGGGWYKDLYSSGKPDSKGKDGGGKDGGGAGAGASSKGEGGGGDSAGGDSKSDKSEKKTKSSKEKGGGKSTKAAAA